MPTPLDIYTATSSQAHANDQLFGNLIQDSYNNIAQAQKESVTIGQGIISSAINAKQVAVDEAYKTNALILENKHLDVQAQQNEIMNNYRKDQLDATIQQHAAELERQKQADANRIAIAGMQAQANILRVQGTTLTSQIKLDDDRANTLTRVNTQNPMGILFPDPTQVVQQNDELPKILARRDANMAKLTQLQGVMDTFGSTIQLAQSGTADIPTLIKSISGHLAPVHLDPNTYTTDHGKPLTNADALKGISAISSSGGSGLDSGIGNNIQVMPVPWSPRLGIPSPVKLNPSQLQFNIDTFLDLNKGNESKAIPLIRQAIGMYADDTYKVQAQVAQSNFQKRYATQVWDNTFSTSPKDEDKLDIATNPDLKNYLRAGGDPDALPNIRQQVKDIAQQVRDGSYVAPEGITVPAYNKETGMSAAQKQSLRDNIINNLFTPRVQAQANKSVVGALLPTGEFPIAPNKDGFARIPEELSNQEQVDKFNKEVSAVVTAAKNDAAKTVFTPDGNFNEKKVKDALSALPPSVFGIDESGYAFNYGGKNSLPPGPLDILGKAQSFGVDRTLFQILSGENKPTSTPIKDQKIVIENKKRDVIKRLIETKNSGTILNLLTKVNLSTNSQTASIADSFNPDPIPED